MSEFKKKIFQGAAWLTLSRLTMNSLGFVSTIVLARILVPADFGIFAISSAALAIALSITDLSLNSSLVQRAELSQHHFDSVWTISFFRALFIILVFSAIAYPMAFLYQEPRLAAVFFVVGVTGALPGLKSPKVALMTRELLFRQDFIIQVTQKGTIFVFSIALAILLKSYWALVIGSFMGAAMGLITSYLIAPYVPRFSLKAFRELFSYSFWLSMGDTVNTLNWKLDQLILGYLVGRSALGVYTVADNLAALPVRESTSPLVNTLFPAFSRMKDSVDRLRIAYKRAQALICAVSFPVGFGFAAVANLLVPFILGNKWNGAIPIIQILSVTFAMQSITVGLQPLAMAKGETKALFFRDVRTFLIRVPFIAAGFLINGLMGVVVARMISSLIGTVWNMALVSRISGIKKVDQARLASRYFIAAGGILLAVWIVQSAFAVTPDGHHDLLTITCSVIAGVIAYLSIVSVLWLAAGRPEGPETEFLSLYRAASELLKSQKKT
ncbi:lipopolysaccharide biosynthesis protein [Sphingobium phenoxybenzoativorans]|uniref:lipopolysaccharide biosynthesis protein n=1 Tax=Sphingobium phenoxybenzoativorans TaxID=1592790 RepID=UPI0008723FC7|nr:lipopolysaccharide biosynthesis protein [Sphingobium phenoxybenzoativorans]